jgi:hypothetical protein
MLDREAERLLRSNRRRPKSYLRNLTLKKNLNEILPNSDAVGAAREVAQHVGGAANGRLRVEHLATPCVEALDPAAGLGVR